MTVLSVYSIAAFFLSVSIPFILFSFALEWHRKKRKLIFLYTFFRLAAVLFIAMLLNSFFSSEWDINKKQSAVILLEDKSPSMKQLSGETLSAFRNMADKLSLQLRENQNFHRFSFSDKLYKENDSENSASAYSTALGDALLSVNALFPGSDIILLTDAASNAGTDPFLAANMLENYGSRVHALLPEDLRKTGHIDISLSDASSTMVPSEDENKRAFSATIHTENADGGKLPDSRIEIKIDGQLVHSAKVSFHLPIQNYTAECSTSDKLSPGWHEYEISILPLKEEILTSNNSVKGIFQTSSEENVLVIWDRTSPELNAFREIFNSRYSPYEFYYASNFSGLSAKEQLDLIQETSLLLLGNSPAETFHKDAIALLKHQLEKKKIMLIFMTPQDLDSWIDDPDIGKFIPLAGKGVRASSMAMHEHKDGESTPVSLPFSAIHVFPVANENHIVLQGTANDTGRKIPLLFSNEYSAVVPFSGSWRWKLSPDRNIANTYYLFWEKLLSSVDRFGHQGFRLTLSPREDVFLPNAYFASLHNYDDVQNISSATLNILTENRRKETPLHSLTPTKDASVYSALIQLNSPGIHWFSAKIIADGKTWLSNEYPVEIKDDRLETTRMVDTGKVLSQLTEITGGSIITEKNIGDSDKLLQRKEYQVFERKPYSLSAQVSRSVLYALFALLFLTAEWLIRKLESLRNA